MMTEALAQAGLTIGIMALAWLMEKAIIKIAEWHEKKS